MERTQVLQRTPITPMEAGQLSKIVLELAQSSVLPPILARQRGGFREILRIAMAAQTPGIPRNGGPEGLREEVLRQTRGIEGDNTVHEARIDPVALEAMRTALGKIHALFNGTVAPETLPSNDGSTLNGTMQLDVGALNEEVLATDRVVTEAHPNEKESKHRPPPRKSAAERLKELLKDEEGDENLLEPDAAEFARSLGLEVGGDPRMAKAWNQLVAFAGTEMIMLVRGQPGTGKEPFGQAVHGIRRRNGITKKDEMITVNAAAINDGIVESELFGHKRGAFTGAIEDRKGKFELAHEGTLFLDEIGDMPLNQQAKLLRVLENGVVTPAGSNSNVHVKVKVVCATNRPLEQLADEGKFRKDLLSRLKGCQIALPAWTDRTSRHRKAVIDFLAARLRAKDSAKREILLEDAALLLLLESQFAGNVREVRDVLERSHVFASIGEKGDSVRIAAAHVRQALEQDIIETGASSMRSYGHDLEFGQLAQDGEGHRLSFAVRLPLRGHIDDVKQSVAEVLAWEVCQRLESGHIGNTAKRLGVSRRTATNYTTEYRRKTTGRAESDGAADEGEEEEK